MATESMSTIGVEPEHAALRKNAFPRTVLRGNALFSTLTGALCLLDASQVAGWLGLAGATPTLILRLLGVGLLGFALLIWWISSRQLIHRKQLLELAVADFAWVAASAVLLLAGWVSFSTSGIWIVAIVADIVLLFGLLEVVAMRKG